MDKFPLFPPIFWNVVRRGSGSFEFYLLVCVIRLECHSIRGHSPCAKRLDRGETLKHHFQTDAVASSWLNQSRDDRKSETTPRNKHQIIRQIRVDDRRKSIHELQGIYTTRRAWRHTWRHNPTEDKRAFRRMPNQSWPIQISGSGMPRWASGCIATTHWSVNCVGWGVYTKSL